MKKPAFGSLTNPSVDILKEIEEIGKLGFDYAEIGMEGPKGEPAKILKNKKNIEKILKKYNMFAIGHTSWWAELGSNYETVRKGWIEHCKESIRVANQLNLPILNVHATCLGMYLKDKKDKKIILDNMIKSLKELVKYAQKYKIVIVLENMPSMGITEITDMKYIMNRVPGLKFHLDIGHSLCTGSRDTKNVLKWINSFKSKLYHIHIHDNSGKGDEHMPLGTVSLDCEKVVKLLKKIKYDKTITFEVFTKDRDLVKFSMDKLKKLF